MLDEARLERLISAYFDQSLLSPDKAELERILLGSARAREIFLEHAEWHGLMREWALQEMTTTWMEDSTPAPAAAPSRKQRRRPWPALAAAAACAALAAIYFPREKPAMLPTQPGREGRTSAENASDRVAFLGQATGVDWAENSATFAVGSALPKGTLAITKGTLRLDFYSGARVFLEGPASFELVSSSLARLVHGKLTASVPPPAEGFTIINGDLRVVDRGTEFGMNTAGSGECEVHVFDGKVELQGDSSSLPLGDVLQGNAVAFREGRLESIPADRRTFIDPATITREAARENQSRWETWRAASEAFREIPGLLVYFNFEGMEAVDTAVPNQAASADPSSSGTIIGCDRLPGRWASKSALGFARTSDRVRFRAEGTTSTLTMMAWVRVDSLPLDHNSLLSMAPEFTGEIHWKLNRQGRLLIGIRAADEFSFDAWERLESPQIVTEQDFGHWIHLATVINSETGVMKHFLNGQEVASGTMTRRIPVKLGLANLGNFDHGATMQSNVILRSFNGRIDEFALFGRALPEAEIQAIHSRGAQGLTPQ